MLTILVANDTWGLVPRDLAPGPVPFRLTFDPADVFTADAVVFHVPTLAGPPQLPKLAGQRWVAWSMESEVNYPRLADPSFMRRFDLSMTYRRDADVWFPYVGVESLAELALPPQPKTEAAPAVFVASNARDRSGRSDYVRELMRHMPVDSYGRWLNNRRFPEDRGRSTRLATFARYRFTLAFENSVAPDYVTEKFFDALTAGSVPVYLGAREVGDFAPGEDCYLDVRDFPGPAALAAHLVHLAAHEDEYARHLAWKSAPPRPAFLALLERARGHPLHRLAALLAGGRPAPASPGSRG